MKNSSKHACSFMVIVSAFLTMAIAKDEVKLALIGESFGKEFYFVDVLMNWTDSHAFCSRHGMQLAAVTTKGQLDVLESWNTYAEGKAYWTAGKGSVQLDGFLWDGRIVKPTNIPYRNAFNVENNLCVAMRIKGKELLFFPRECFGTKRALCERQK